MNAYPHSGAIAAQASDVAFATAPSSAARTGSWRRIAAPALRAAVTAWLLVAVCGQLFFAVYVVGFYGRALAQGQPERWRQVMPHGYVAGETFFNVVLGLHLALAVAIVLAGAMQLVPQIRRHAPALHRWVGRFYLGFAATLAVGGATMVWGRGAVGDVAQHLAITLNALLIVVFAGLAWRAARARRVDAHRRWALRLFLAVSGVWFFRIGLSFWIVVNGAAVGFDPDTFTGPALTTLSFAQYLVPLAVLQLYFFVQERRDPRGQLVLAGLIGALSVATAGGIAAAAMLLWLPHL